MLGFPSFQGQWNEILIMLLFHEIGQKCFRSCDRECSFFVAWVRTRFQSWLVLSDSFLFQLSAVCFLVNVLPMFELDSVWFIEFSLGVSSLVLLDCGQLTLSTLSFRLWNSKIDFWWNRSPRFEFFWWSGLLDFWSRSLFEGIGLVVLSSLGSRQTHPVCVRVRVHAQVAWYPWGSIPALIGNSVKLLCLLIVYYELTNACLHQSG